jgi:hypothetical protein
VEVHYAGREAARMRVRDISFPPRAGSQRPLAGPRIDAARLRGVAICTR